MKLTKKNFWLMTIALFALGLTAGAIAKTVEMENDFSHFSPLHLLLIFSSGLSIGAMITRFRYENKLQKMQAEQFEG